MDKFYDNEFLANTLWGLNSDIADLERWSVYNGDKRLDDIAKLKDHIKIVEAKINREVK